MRRFLILFLFVSSWLSAQQLRVETDASEISYEASHVVHDWSGTSNQVQGVVVLENAVPTRIAIVTSVASFDSRNESRDAHALEVLEALLFPKVSFYSDKLSLEGETLSITGNLKFHGKTITLTTNANWVKKDDVWMLKGDFDFKPSKFDITLPAFMLIKIRDNIHISFRLELRTFAL
jgi:polyisoprenoid-binding protein YceI